MNTSDLKRSNSTDDAYSSLRDSGVSISGEFSENDQTSTDSSERKKPRSTLAKIHECAVCSKRFGGRTDLRRHLLIHTNEKPHKCEICQKAYRQEINLKNHIKTSHSDKKDFVCRFCMKPFPLKQRLRLHVRLHTGEKPYSCPHCTKTFARGGQLNQHLLTHDKHKKNICGICSTAFSSERNLKKHMELHSEGGNHACKLCQMIFTTSKKLQSHVSLEHAGVNEFECEICEKKINGDVEAHMKIHVRAKPFECEVCKTVFRSKCQIKIHMRVHTGERPFQCRVCWQTFGHASVLKLHIRKHTGEKPFLCVLCKDNQIGFSQLTHLKTHMRAIHKQDKAYVCEGCKECFKVKFQLEGHMNTCKELASLKKIDRNSESEKIRSNDAQVLERIRYLIAVLLKKISTQEKLAILGFEKRLIDNVLVASLKLANRKCYEQKNINELDRLKLNVQEFLEWIVPSQVMDAFKKECSSIESILDKIVTMYLKKTKGVDQ